VAVCIASLNGCALAGPSKPNAAAELKKRDVQKLLDEVDSILAGAKVGTV
jgi:hypothetical protein